MFSILPSPALCMERLISVNLFNQASMPSGFQLQWQWQVVVLVERKTKLCIPWLPPALATLWQ